MDINVNGKICLVTGGARGIGRKIVETFAASGAKKVYAGDLAFDGFDEVTGAYENVSPIELNVTNAAAVGAVVEKIVAEEGRIDVVVNNAGITRDGLIQKMSDDDWASVISVNLTAVFVVTRAVAMPMMSAGSGCIINMASVVGIDGNIGQTNYAATKGGVISMTKTWAKELTRKGAKIRVNAIAPGFIRTPMTDKVPQKVLDLMEENASLKRLGEPEDIANLALYLASEAGSFITGQAIRVDGGLKL